MSQVEPAQFLRWVDPGEEMREVIEEARTRTWQFEAEHALLETRSGLRLMVRGGRDGISFPRDDAARALDVDWTGATIKVVRILWHTHPRVTGPSDGDLAALGWLGQTESMIYELGGDLDGTQIRPKR